MSQKSKSTPHIVLTMRRHLNEYKMPLAMNTKAKAAVVRTAGKGCDHVTNVKTMKPASAKQHKAEPTQ